MKRTFVAVEIDASDKLKEAFGLIRNRLQLERINWVSTDDLHITTHFLGDTGEGLIPELIAQMEKSLQSVPAFELTIRSLGIFRSLRNPHVIWLGCDPCPALQIIKNELDQIISAFGFQSESRDFSPHLTLGRIKQMHQVNQLSQLITQYKDVVFQKSRIEYLVFYESKLTSTGPEYIPIHVFYLQNRSPVTPHQSL